MSNSRSQCDILLVSVAVFILFAVSSLWADPTEGPDDPGDTHVDSAAVVEVEPHSFDHNS